MANESIQSGQRRMRGSSMVEPWYMDAPAILPIVLGPLAFLLTVAPALESLLMGQGSAVNALFMKACMRMLGFCVLGAVLGVVIRMVAQFLAPRVGQGLDVTVDDRSSGQKEGTNKENLIKETISFPVAVDYLTPGMKLAEAAVLPDGQQLAAASTLLTQEMVDVAKQTGVVAWQVEGVRYRTEDSAVKEDSAQGDESEVESSD